MDKLPKEWEIKYLPDIVLSKKTAIKRGPFGSALKKEFFVNEGYKVYEQKNAIKNDFNLGDYYVNETKFQELKAFEVKPGDIIISCSGTIGKVAIMPENAQKGIINQALLKISIDERKINKSFFVKWFENFVLQESFQESVKGAAIKNIASVSDLKTIPIPTPKNLPEQTRIVKKLDSLFERIDKSIALLQENIRHTEALMASVLDEVFEQAENNKKFEIKLLKDAVRVINGRAYKQQELLNEGKYPVIRVGNFFSNRSWYYSDLELDEDKYCDNGDLLYAWSASFGPKIWDGDRSIFHYHIWKMEIISPNLLKDYLYYMLLRDTEKIKSEGGRGVGMIHITKGDIEVRKITLPPLVNQNQIVDKIKVLNQNLEKLLTEQQSKLNYLKALKASLLDKAFKGEL